jgi:hypothetical protein
VTPTTTIEPLARNYDPKSVVTPKFYNDLDVSDAGIVYFTDSSYLHSRSHNREELLDGAPRGRLLEYNLQTQKLRTIVCGMHFPNGVQIYSQASEKSEGESTKLLVAELARFRVLLIDTGATDHNLLNYCGEHGSLDAAISSPQNRAKPAVKVFLDSAPGFLDNIREDVYHSHKDNRDGLLTKRFIIGVGTLSVKPFSLVWFAYQSRILRDIIGKFVPMQWVENLVPKYGLAIVVDERGEIIKSWHDPTGKAAHLISQADRHPKTGDIWLGSHSGHHVAVVNSKYVR